MASAKPHYALDAEPPSERTLPCNVEIEWALLGALLVDNHWFDRAALTLRPEDFYDPLHQRMYAEMVGLFAKGMHVTPLTLKAMLEGDAGLAEVGGITYLLGLARSASVLPNVADYIAILKDLELRRHLIRIGEDITNQAYAAPYGVAATEVAGRASEALFQAASAGEAKPALSLDRVAGEVLDMHERRFNGERFPTVKIGLHTVDAEIGGFRGTDLVGIAGRSGMGKSALLGGIALGAAMRGTPVLVFSIEMANGQWAERTLCDIDFYENGGKDALEYRKFRNGTLTEGEFDRAARARLRLNNLPLHIIDDDQLNIEDLSARARTWAIGRGPLGMIVVDYAQIVAPTDQGRDRSREQEVNHIARGLKRLAKKLGWVVVAGIQLLNKGMKGTDADRRPTAQDIRESGGIENECDVVFATYRPAWYLEQRKAEAKAASQAEWDAWQADHQNAKHKFELLNFKQRHGRRIDFELWCDMGASAVRDQRPIGNVITQEEAKGLFA